MPASSHGYSDLPNRWSEALIERQLSQLTGPWLRPDGLLATAFEGPRCVDPTPLSCDLGDTLPFLVRYGRLACARQQVERSAALTQRGLLSVPKLDLFYNHDFLFGLLEAAQRDVSTEALPMLLRGMEGLAQDCDRFGLLRDRPGIARTAAPFNGGFIEIAVDLAQLLGDSTMLDLAERWAKAWVRTPYFRLTGMFARKNTALMPLAGLALSHVYRTGPVRLFKDTTNMAWGLLSLFRVRPHAWLREALERFRAGFRATVWNGGLVLPHLKHDRRTFDLIACTFSLDLMCDLHHAGLGGGEWLEMATATGDALLRRQWPNGLFPTKADDSGDSGRDHLDVMTDLTVALCKLFELTRESRFLEAASRVLDATVPAHNSDDGLVLAVGRQGQVVERRVVVKYQALALKIPILLASGSEIYADPSLWEVLRDR